MTTLFTVTGPIKVLYYQGKAGHTITDDNVKEFWKSHASIGQQRGCYVFGMRAGKGLTPAYVGKATKNFKQEVFAPQKLAKYQQFLADYQKGTPIIFFLIPPKKRGAPNAPHMGELETFLIQIGIAANSSLLNIKGTQAEQWGITGILRGSKGKPSISASQFRKLMKF